jgi:5-methylcytosine-specific restriction endonuclease McrA
MPDMPPNYRPPSAPTRRETNKAADLRRGSARQRGYTTAWDKASAGHIRNDPCCRYCDLAGDTVPATLTDHLYPHQGQQWLFWLKLFWVSSCKPCHDQWKQRLERQGLMALDDLAQRLGLPTLAAHLADLVRQGRDPRPDTPQGEGSKVKPSA